MSYLLPDDLWTTVKAELDGVRGRLVSEGGMITYQKLTIGGSSFKALPDGVSEVWTLDSFLKDDVDLLERYRVAYVAIGRVFAMSDGYWDFLGLTCDKDALHEYLTQPAFAYASCNDGETIAPFSMFVKPCRAHLTLGRDVTRVIGITYIKYALMAAHMVRSRGAIITPPVECGSRFAPRVKAHYSYLRAQLKHCAPGASVKIGDKVFTVDSIPTDTKFNEAIDCIVAVLRNQKAIAALTDDLITYIMDGVDALVLLYSSYGYACARSVVKRHSTTPFMSRMEQEAISYLPVFLNADCHEYSHGVGAAGWQPRNPIDPAPFALVNGRISASLVYKDVAAGEHLSNAELMSLRASSAQVIAMNAALCNAEIFPVLWLRRDAMTGLKNLTSGEAVTEEALVEAIGSLYRVNQLSKKACFTRGVRYFERRATLNSAHHDWHLVSTRLCSYNSASEFDDKLKSRYIKAKFVPQWLRSSQPDPTWEPADSVSMLRPLEELYTPDPSGESRLINAKHAIWITTDSVYEVPLGTEVPTDVAYGTEDGEVLILVGTSDLTTVRRVRVTIMTTGGYDG